MTKLERLNVLLKELNLPDHRKIVSDSGSNLAWLQKHAGTRNQLSEELQSLLSLSIHDLMQV